MEYMRVSIETSSAYAEVLADMLAPLTGGCEVDDPETVHQWAASGDSRWDYLGSELFENPQRPVTVNFYVADDDAGQDILRQASLQVACIQEEDAAGLWGSLTLRIQPMENQDWETSWRAWFKPIAIGERLLVRPSWEHDINEAERLVLTIDPSSSFGTGTHATTRMCLSALEQMHLDGKRVLDIGCGSGILACGALLLGASHVICCDIEDDAMAATAENMARNAFDNRQYTLKKGNILSDDVLFAQLLAAGPYAAITANIVSDILIAMAVQLAALLADQGQLVLSGILCERAHAVISAFEAAGLALQDQANAEGWTALTFTHTFCG